MTIVKRNDLRLTDIPRELTQNQSIFSNIGELIFMNNEFEAIPDTVTVFNFLKKLSFACNKIVQVNEKLFTMTQLETLCLNQNRISTISQSLTSMKGLSSLEICANKLSTLTPPTCLSRLDLSANFLTDFSYSCQSLTYLDVSQNDLSNLPNLDCPNVKQINASFNNIVHLPDSISNLSSLRYLDLKNNKLESLPDTFALLSSLTFLQISNNPISSVPSNFTTMRLKKFHASQTIKFSFDPLPTLRELFYSKVESQILFMDYSAMSNLENLDVSYNQFTTLTVTSPSLITLNCSYNVIQTLSMSKTCTAQKIFARHNQIASIDSSIANSQKLVIADFSNNKLKNLPLKPDLPRIQYLNVGFNRMTILDYDFSKMNTLTYFDVSFNSIHTITNNIGDLTNLKALVLAGNPINSLPNDLTNLVNLTKLHCSNNGLAVFPNVILALSNLQKLYIASNHIRDLPDLSCLKELQTLDLSNCYLVSAQNVNNLPKLEQLNLSNNYLTEPPQLSGCDNLIYLDLSFNALERSTSDIEVKKLNKLRMLDLSFNDITSLPNHGPELTIRTDGCGTQRMYSLLDRFSKSLEFKTVRITCAGAQMCADRDEMQDSFICIPHFAAPDHFLFAAVDGHSGFQASYSFTQNFPKILYEQFKENNQQDSIEDCLLKSFDKIEEEFVDNDIKDGAVVTVVFVTPKKIYTAQCGDCRGVYITKSGIHQLAPEHKTSDRHEQVRIRSEGGFVDQSSRVCGLLVARSVGDIKNKPIITHKPDITVCDRRDDEQYLVVATDGVWDEVSNSLLLDILQRNRRIQKTSELVSLLRDTAYVSCVQTQIPDNIGIVLCRF
ncbi:leucine-rich repeat containing protein, putative [Entamoeba invadens IP1]|uniref:Leucine-rich repeat containing protein, putative n=1 Tax=Entamoeba invadens IP1 TaxID=370355 RepID=A0A0A1U1D5_ENTIV|nr:leucine-rich repeat containing protein, putative [Entamoeba invadens IP1]ELP84718.1 leucine-rich repeat containing protein, putative [Entamoeba invadens IP1]|eukprot:XP_004184064.1 leucine-rich repeat containing protein, putative [Entamoeba invadens IP1]